MSRNGHGDDATAHNNPIKLSVRVVTPRAVARVAPTRPAAYRVRYADMKPLVKSILSVACLSAFVLASCASTRVVSMSAGAHSSTPVVDPSQIVFVVGAAHSSQALAGVRVSLIGRDGIELELGTTNEFGRLKVPKSLLQSHDVRVILFSHHGFFTGAFRIDSESDYYSANERYIELASFAVI